jgi:hypothetical protein
MENVRRGTSWARAGDVALRRIDRPRILGLVVAAIMRWKVVVQ